MTDLIERTRPTAQGVSAEWTPELSQQVFDDVVAGRVDRMRGLRRPWPLAVAASLIVAVLLAVPLAFPGWFTQSASAEELGRVARVAGEQPRLGWTDGQFLRVQSIESQTGDLESGGSDQTRRVVSDDFHTVDGWTWSDRTVNGQVERFLFPPSWGWSRPDYAASMPTEPHLLDALLRARALGSSSQDEAVFTAIGTMLGAEAAPPQVRAAAIGVLGLNRKVTVERGTDPLGRPALRATFVDEAQRPGMRQSLYLAPDTGELLARGREGSRDDAAPFRNEWVITHREVVAGLPAHLVDALGTEKVGKEVINGQTRPIAHNPGPDPVPVPQQSYTPAPRR